MTLNDLRTFITVLSFLIFIGIVAWAWSTRQQGRFDAAARSILED